MKYLHEWASKFNAFFFDLDGTLIDSNKLHEKAFIATIKSTGVVNETFNYNNYMGMKTTEVFTSLGFDKNYIEKLTNKKQTLYRDFIKNGEVEIFPYVYKLLKIIKLKGYKAYIVTGSSFTSVSMILKYSKIGLFINDFVCGDEINISKPDPEIYLYAMKKFNYNPDEVLAVEDSHNGIISAVNAGLKTISVNEYYNHQLVKNMSLKDIYLSLNMNQEAKRTELKLFKVREKAE